MKLQSKVVWAEGMHLAPHHFQAQSRYFEQSVHFATTGLWNHAYGFADCQLDTEALRNGTVSLLSARGMFEDGLPFDFPGCDVLPATLNIVDKFSPTADNVRVSLAVPRWLADGQNCSVDGDPEQLQRYSGMVRTLPDENTGRDDKPVKLGHKNIRLIIESEATDDWLTLPLAQVVRDGSGQFVFDPLFIPPSVRIGSSDCLTAMLRRLVESWKRKARWSPKSSTSRRERSRLECLPGRWRSSGFYMPSTPA